MLDSGLILKSQMLHYFIIMFKKRNLNISSFYYFSIPALTISDLARKRRYIYLYYFYLCLNSKYFPFYNVFLKSNIFIEDYFFLRLFDYVLQTRRAPFQKLRQFIYQRTSKYFLPIKNQIFPYNIFNIRVYWFGYLSLGKYLEYFRYFKYLEYLKRIPNNISYNVKNTFRSRHLFNSSLLNQYKLTLLQHNYTFFDNTQNRIKFKFKFLVCNVKFLTRKLHFSLNFWASSIFYKFVMILFSKFHNFSFIWFTHRVWFHFKFRLTEYAKFRSLLPRFWYSSLKNLKFAFTKWFFRYFVKQTLIIQNIKSFSIFNNISIFHNIDIVLFNIIHKVHYHRVLLQLDKDVHLVYQFFF